MPNVERQPLSVLLDKYLTGKSPIWYYSAMKRHPKVRRVTIHGKRFWQTDRYEHGKRKRYTFAEQDDLKAFLAKKREEDNAVEELQKVERSNHAVVRLSHLAPGDRAAVSAAVEIIKAAGGKVSVHLPEAARHYARSFLAFAGSKTIGDAVTDFLRAKSEGGKRQRTVEGYRRLLTPIADRFKGRMVPTVTLPELEGYCRGVTPGSRNHVRIALVGLLNYCAAHGWTDSNPALKLPKVKADRDLPVVFTPEEVRKLLAAASEHAPEMVPYYAVGVFAGLRPENELRNLDWTNIRLTETPAFIRVEAATSKTRRRRDVELSANAVAWLVLHNTNTGRLAWNRKAHEKVIEKAGVKWSRDIMRHTYGSYLLASTENEALTASRMGNSVGIVHGHYKNLRSKAQAVEFWKIAPQTAGVLQFPKAKAG